MSEQQYDYDYFVIGAGSAGVRSARIASSHGAKVGIAEASALGGTCVNLGCVPKKIMAYGADYHGHFHDARGYGWDVPEDIAFDWTTLIQNQRNEVKRLNSAYEKTLKNAGVDILNGYARFVDAHTLDVDGHIVKADKILIAVGGKPRVPHQPGGELMVLSDDMFSWPQHPKKAVIVGGGYIAVEFAHILHGVGVEVDLIYRGDLFLRGFDHDIRTHLAKEMKNQGVKVHFDSDLKACEKTNDGFLVHTSTGELLSCDVALAAIGRVPNVEGLNLEAAGVSVLDNGQIDIDEDYRTNIESVFACGDVANRDNLTPVAIKEGHVIADRLFNAQNGRYVNYDNIATAVFSDPPIGTVGLSEEDAKAQGYDVICYSSTFTPMRNQLAQKQEKTFMKLVVDQKSDRVLGLHMAGLDAPEILQGFAVAMNCGATKADFDRTMPIHPTSAEEFVTLT
ncbi:MAG: glutathione-disulfide reductase [Bdellovibrionales bacterium]